MDLLPVTFLVGLVLIGGLIAWAADRLGKKLGKKRLSIFGLRPRHTAALGTILLGIVISLFTIVLVASLSSGVRQWILEGRVALRQRDQLERERKVEEQKLRSVQQQYVEDQKRIQRLEQAIAEGSGKLATQQLRIDQQLSQVAALQTRQQNLQARLLLANRNLLLRTAQIHQKDAQIKQVQATLMRNRGLLAYNEKLLANAVKRLNNSEMESYKLDQQTVELSNKIKQKTQELAQLQTERDALVREQSTLSNEVAEMGGSLARETEALSQAKQQMAALQDNIALLTQFMDSTFGPSRLEPMIYAYRQEVTRLPVSDHLTRAQAQNALESLLRQARLEAAAHGAKEHPGYQVADIMGRSEGNSGPSYTAEQYKAKIVDQLVDKAEDQVLIATSSLNAFQGEVVSLEVDVKPNPLAFQRGEIVASSNIDGAQSNKKIFQEISQLVGVRVRERARERKMIPRPDGTVGFGTLPGDQLFETLQTIKAVGRSVRLQAIALDDTRAADTLRLDLTIR